MTLTADMAGLGERLRGTALGPDHPHYEAARHIHNHAYAGRPALIVRCADAGDVMTALAFAGAEGLEVAVRAGGHSVPGYSSVDGGLVIDLTPLRYVQVDPVARIARVGGGATARDLDHATHAFGLATPTATVSDVGVAGFTLGGGIGYLSRAHGLACDNLAGADVVLADGSFTRAGADGDPDLLWALRGGGGNFGIVTELRLRLHPVDVVTGGPMLWPIEATERIVGHYREWMPEQPDDIYAFVALLTVPPAEHFPPAARGRTACALVWCNTAPAERSQAALDEFRSLAPPLLDGVGQLPYPALQAAFDEPAALGTHNELAGRLFATVPDGAVREYVRFAGAAPTPLCQTHLYPLDGAAARADRDAAAWPWRDAAFAQMMAGVSSEAGHDAELRAWTRGFADALAPYALPGCYSNFMMDEPDAARTAYGAAHDRLAALKAAYDPDNVLHRNVNVRPG